MVTGYLVSETVVDISVNAIDGIHQSIDGFGVFIGYRITGIFFQEAEEAGVKTQAGFAKHLTVKCEKGNFEIITHAIEADNSVGQQYDLGVLYNFVFFQIDCQLCPTVQAKKNGSSFQFAQTIF